MTVEQYPLLASFFREGRGTVYYKAYPPHRGDDMQSVIELARILPSGVAFVPIPPRIPHVGDLRYLVKAFLESVPAYSLQEASDPFPVREADSPADRPTPARSPGEGTIDEDASKREREIERSVLELLTECLSPRNRPNATKILDAIRDRPLYAALRDIVASTIYGGVDDLSFAPIVPDEGPILVIGRPELFHHDAPLKSHKSPHALLNVLREAGYPNRFDFLSEAGDVRNWTRCVSDRKTNVCYLRGPRFQDDVGFVFCNRLDDGRTVIVAAGTTSLGTYAAVKLLTENRPAFAAAMQRHNEAQKPAAIDLAFRCCHHRATQAMLFPFAQPAQQLSIVPLNANDMVGFRWNRASHELFGPLLKWWSPEEHVGDGRSGGREPDVELGCTWDERPASPRDRAARRIVNVRVRAHAFRAGPHRIICGRRTAALLGQIRNQLADDRRSWKFRIHNRPVAHGETFRPILLVGETGTGKTIVAECLAEVWSGTTLDEVRHTWPRGGSGSRSEGPPNALLDAADKALELKLRRWPERGPVSSPRMITFSPSAFPQTMLEKEFFGAAARYASGTGAACGVFLQAGTGVLFLDELFELPPEQLPRLLVVLQKGTVRPLGAEHDYAFHCRLVAATNQADSIQHLEQLASQSKLNPAIVARFKLRYELSPLRERPEEILPQLLYFLRQRIERDGFLESTPAGSERVGEVYVRISRPALDTLLGHDFPENVRELERFVLSLPRDLLASFLTRHDDVAAPAEATASAHPTAILLSHLNVLRPGRSPSSKEGEPGESHEIDETEFYQLTLELDEQRLAPNESEWSSDSTSRGGSWPTTEGLEASFPPSAERGSGSGPRADPARDAAVPRVEASLDVASVARLTPVRPLGIHDPEVEPDAAWRQALHTLRQRLEFAWVDRIFGTGEVNSEGDFPLGDAVRELIVASLEQHSSARAPLSSALESLFRTQEFLDQLHTVCNPILANWKELPDSTPITYPPRRRKRKKADNDVPPELDAETKSAWQLVRRRFPFAAFAVPMHLSPQSPKYNAECDEMRSRLRESHDDLRRLFGEWKQRTYGDGNATELLSLLLGENFSNTH